MLHVRFVLSFDMLRAIQSTYGTVYCFPGALSPFCLSTVHHVLSSWRDQRFLGVPCTFGEYRALTNLILESGLDTVYQRNAVVHTIAPETYVKLTKIIFTLGAKLCAGRVEISQPSAVEKAWKTRWNFPYQALTVRARSWMTC